MNPREMNKKAVSVNTAHHYFEAIFYIQKQSNEECSLLISELLEHSSAFEGIEDRFIRRVVVSNDSSGGVGYEKAQRIILDKSKRAGFKTVLVINHLLENHPDGFIDHLDFMVDEMRTNDWNYWQIESVSETVLTSSFKEDYEQQKSSAYAYAFNLPNN